MFSGTYNDKKHAVRKLQKLVALKNMASSNTVFGQAKHRLSIWGFTYNYREEKAKYFNEYTDQKGMVIAFVQIWL
jgi:hypothetical protein